MANLSAWRVNDVVAYDLTLEVACTLISSLLNVARLGGDDAARQELAEIRQAVRAVNSYDRVAVEALSDRMRARVGQLSGSAS